MKSAGTVPGTNEALTSVHCCSHQMDGEKEARAEPARQPVGWAVKRQERTEPVWGAVGREGIWESWGKGIHEFFVLSLQFFCESEIMSKQRVKGNRALS